jgi:glycosyltransferase involved in cell wall biosynthesis
MKKGTFPVVHQHVLLMSTGGAARVASILGREWSALGMKTTISYEVRDAEVEEGVQASPEQAAATAPEGAVILVHSTANWREVLQGCLERSNPVVLALHDCRLLTGGCPYPLECDGWLRGCYEPCPREFPEANRLQQEKRELLRQVRPQLAVPSAWIGTMAGRALPELSICMIPNGVEAGNERLSTSQAKQAVGVSSRAKVVLFAAHGGERAAYKAGGEWRRIFSVIKKRIPTAVAFFVGGGEMRREGDIALWPFVDRKTMDLFMQAADVLAYPTLADNHPLEVLEAMHRGLPVVASAVGGIPEILRPGGTGILVRPGDWDALAVSVATLLGDRGLARRVAIAACKDAEKRFSADRMASDYLDFFMELLKRGRSSSYWSE